MKDDNKPELIKEQCYTYKNMNFVVKPVFRQNGRTLREIILRLIKNEIDREGLFGSWSRDYGTVI